MKRTMMNIATKAWKSMGRSLVPAMLLGTMCLWICPAKALPLYSKDIKCDNCYVDITKTLSKEVRTAHCPLGDAYNDPVTNVRSYNLYHCECIITDFASSSTNLVLKDLADLPVRQHNYPHNCPHHFLWQEVIYYDEDSSWLWADSWNYLLVTAVESNAFKGKTKLQYVRLPDTCRTIGTNAFNGCTALTCIELQEGLESIGDYAFANCTSLTNIVIPNSVTNIGYNAFHGCTNLVSVSLSPGLKSIQNSMFKDCTNLKTLSLPAGLQNIGDYAFRGCSSLTNLVIPTSVTNIGEGVFYDCTGLVEIALPDGVREIPDYAFTLCTGLKAVTMGSFVTSIGEEAFECGEGLTLVIPESVKDVADNAFWGCEDLTLVVGNNVLADVSNSSLFEYCSGVSLLVSTNVTSIGEGMLRWCTEVTSVTLPNSVTNIGDGAFYACSGLTNVIISDSVTSIGDSAFSGCSALTSVAIPDSVASIGWHAFSDCSSLTSFSVASGNPVYMSASGLILTKDGKALLYGVNGEVVIPDGVTSIEDSAFAGCSALTSVTIPDSVTSIGWYAFQCCDNLKNVTIPDSVTNIVNGAFYCCTSLTRLTIPDSVASIGDYAFSGCSALTSVAIPDSVTSIGSGAFSECSSLKDLTIPGSVTNVGWNMLEYCDGLETLYMPASWQGKVVYGESWDSYAGVPSTCTIIYYEPEAPTATTSGVPYSWLQESAADILAANGGDYEAAAKAKAPNGRAVWECYVAGLSTTEEAAQFKVKSFSFVDGKAVIEWAPDLNGERSYKLLGKRTLADTAWDEVPDGADVNTEGWRFFGVRVELPQK